jgi:hypothetical protein
VIFFEWVNREDGKATNERFKLHLDEVNYPKQFSLWFDSQNLFDRWYKENPDKHDELVDLFLDCEKNVLESTFSDNEKVENLLKFHIGIVLCMSGNKDLESYFKK